MTEAEFDKKAQQALADGYSAEEIAKHKATMKFDTPPPPVSIDSPTMALAKQQANEHFDAAKKAQTTNIAGYDVPNSLALPVAAAAVTGAAAYGLKKLMQPAPTLGVDEQIKQETLRKMRLENDANDPSHPNYAKAPKPVETPQTPVTPDVPKDVASVNVPEQPAQADLQAKIASIKSSMEGSASPPPEVSPTAAPEAPNAPVVTDPPVELQSTVSKVVDTPTAPLTTTNSPNTVVTQNATGATTIEPAPPPEPELKTPAAKAQRQKLTYKADDATTAKLMLKEGTTFLPGYGPGDNHIFNTYGNEGRKAVIKDFNNGVPVGSYENAQNLEKQLQASKVGPAIPKDIRTERGIPPSGFGNFGKLGTALKVGGIAGLGLAVADLANAKTTGERANVVGNTAMGVMPPAAQALMFSKDAGESPSVLKAYQRFLMTPEQKKIEDKIEMNRYIAKRVGQQG